MNLTDLYPNKATMTEHAPLNVASRARQSLNIIREESIKKRYEGEDKTIRSLSQTNNTATCLVTPRSTFSGDIGIQLDKDKASRIKGHLTIDTETITQYLTFHPIPNVPS